MKIKENEKLNKYQDLARELKDLWNTKVTVMPIVLGAFGAVPKKDLKGDRGTGDRRKRRDHIDHSIVQAQVEYLKESW